MNKLFKKVPVYTHDSVGFLKDEKKQQKVIDEWTDKLATKMAAMSSDKAIIDEFGIQINCRERRGGHNRKTVEALNEDGYVVMVFHSVNDASKHFRTSVETILRSCRGKRRGNIQAGIILRFRDAEKKKKKKK